jgi:hypothetical protein
VLKVFSSAIRFNFGRDDENENSQIITTFLIQHLEITNAKTNQYNGQKKQNAFQMNECR